MLFSGYAPYFEGNEPPGLCVSLKVAHPSGAKGTKNDAVHYQPFLCARKESESKAIRMSLSRGDLIKQMNQVSSEILREKGYICFVDILIRIGKLTKVDHDAWRYRKVPYLERVIKVNLLKLNHMLRTFQQSAKRGGLLASKTSYVSWGKGSKTPLTFSKFGDPNIEEAYSTHFVKPKEDSQRAKLPKRSTGS